MRSDGTTVSGGHAHKIRNFFSFQRDTAGVVSWLVDRTCVYNQSVTVRCNGVYAADPGKQRSLLLVDNTPKAAGKRARLTRLVSSAGDSAFEEAPRDWQSGEFSGSALFVENETTAYILHLGSSSEPNCLGSTSLTTKVAQVGACWSTFLSVHSQNSGLITSRFLSICGVFTVCECSILFLKF